jgi:hypothetical protein
VGQLATFVPLDTPKPEPVSKLLRDMFGFEGVHTTKPGESEPISFDVTRVTLQRFDGPGMSTVYPGRYLLHMSNGIESVQKSGWLHASR